MPIAYPHVAERLFGRPHAIEPIALRAIIDGPLAHRVLTGEKIDSKSAKKGRDIRHARLTAITEAQPVRSADGLVDYAVTPEGIAILPICGVLSRRFDWLALACGFTTYDGIAATLDAIRGDYRAKAILLDIDSPGGEADGMLDIADTLLAIGKEKPVWAVANALAASAAYALAGSASRLLLPRLAQVGSIGCVTIHVDQSLADKAMGLAYTAVYSGARKIDGWGHAPLSSEAQGQVQAMVDHVRDEFAALVGRQGRVSESDALQTEAAVFADSAAVEAGLADAVGTFTDAMAELAEEISPTSRGQNVMSRKVQPAAATVSAENKVPVAIAAAAAEADPEKGEDGGAAPEKKAEDMTPPKPGEQCKLCGQVMPEDKGNAEDPKGDTDKKPDAPAAAAAASYGASEIAATLDLCAIAGLSSTKAKAFIDAKMPVDRVRASLLSARAKAADDRSITPIVLTGDGDGTKSNAETLAGWRERQAMVKAELGIGRRK